MSEARGRKGPKKTKRGDDGAAAAPPPSPPATRAPQKRRRREHATFRPFPVRVFNETWWRRLGATARTIWFQLVCGPGSTPVPGLYQQGRAAYAEALNYTPEQFDAGWRELESAGLAVGDWDARVIWLPGVLDLPRLRPDNGNVIQGYRRWWEEVPESPRKHDWLRELVAQAQARGLHFEQGVVRGFGDVAQLPEGFGEGSPEGPPNEDQDQDQHQHQDQHQEGGDLRAGAREHPPTSRVVLGGSGEAAASPQDGRGEAVPAEVPGPGGSPGVGGGVPQGVGGGVPQGVASGVGGGVPDHPAEPEAPPGPWWRLGVPERVSLSPDGEWFGRIFVVTGVAQAKRCWSEADLEPDAGVLRARVLDALGKFTRRQLAAEAVHLAEKKGLELTAEVAADKIGRGLCTRFFKHDGNDGKYLKDRGHAVELLHGHDSAKFGREAMRALIAKLEAEAEQVREPEARAGARTAAPRLRPIPADARRAAVEGRFDDATALSVDDAPDGEQYDEDDSPEDVRAAIAAQFGPRPLAKTTVQEAEAEAAHA